MSNRVQKWNVGPERRKERETFCGRFGKRTPFLRLRAQLHRIRERTFRTESLDRSNASDLVQVVRTNLERLEPLLFRTQLHRIRGRTLRTESLDRSNARDLVQVVRLLREVDVSPVSPSSTTGCEAPERKWLLRAQLHRM